MQDIGFRRPRPASSFRQSMIAVCFATIAAVGTWQPAYAQSAAQVAIPLSPDFDYRPICKRANVRKLSADWAAWDGKAAIGNYDDMLLDAQALISGNGNVPRDKVRARQMLEYLRQAPYEYAGRASHLLGRLLLDASSGPVDLTRSIELQEEAIAKGFIAGATFLGRLYAEGDVVLPDPLKAEQYLKVAVEAGDPDAALLLARLYSSRPDIAPAPETADLLFKKAIDKLTQALGAGECDVLTLFSDIYDDAQFKVHDTAIAAKWLVAAAKTGDFVAIQRLSRRYISGEGVPVDRAKAVELLEGSAERGHSASRIALAKLLLESRDLPDSTSKAEYWLEAEAKRGNYGAYELLAWMARGDYGGTPDPTAMVSYLEEAAKSPIVNLEVHKQLGVAYFEGTGVKPDPQKALDYLSSAANLGSNSAAYELYRLLNDHSSPVFSEVHPVALLRRAATSGMSQAMAALSDAYSCGIGVERNATVGIRWMERAAAAGNRPSLIAVAQRLLALGTDEGRSGYFRNIRRAASLGDRRAMALLSIAYRDGIGVQSDAGLADSWYGRAVAEGPGRGQALLVLSRMYLNQENGRVDTASAEDLLVKGLDTGDPSVSYELGKLYLDGADGIARNPARAVELFVQAAEAGHTAAMVQLAELEVPAERGGGRDWQAWLNRAADLGEVRALLIKSSQMKDTSERTAILDRILKEPLCDAKNEVAVARVLLASPEHREPAQALIRRALDAESKDASTLYQLAGLALKGMITDAAPNLGLDLMAQAAEAGKVEAMRELGRIYLAGTDTAADMPKALHWLSLAARGGESEALDTMVELVLAQSTPSNLRATALQDVVQALERRALGSSREAALTLSRLYGMMGESDPAYREKARTWLAKAAELGDASAMLQLSDAYATGTYGFEVSAELSTAWLAKSAKAGHREAFERYAIALQMGYGTAPDPREADVWMAKAAVKTQ